MRVSAGEELEQCASIIEDTYNLNSKIPQAAAKTDLTTLTISSLCGLMTLSCNLLAAMTSNADDGIPMMSNLLMALTVEVQSKYLFSPALLALAAWSTSERTVSHEAVSEAAPSYCAHCLSIFDST